MTFIPDSPDPEAWQVLRNENLAVRVQEPLGQVQVLVTIFTFFHICSIYYICSKGNSYEELQKKTILLDLMVISLDFRSQQMPKNPCALRQGRM